MDRSFENIICCIFLYTSITLFLFFFKQVLLITFFLMLVKKKIKKKEEEKYKIKSLMNYQEMKITPFYTPNTVFLSLQAYLAMYRDVFKYHWQYSQSKLLHNHEAIFAKVSRKLKTEASSFYVHCFLEWHWHPDATNLGISWACNVAHAFSEGTSSSRESASLTSFLTFLCVSPISMVDYLIQPFYSLTFYFHFIQLS